LYQEIKIEPRAKIVSGAALARRSKTKTGGLIPAAHALPAHALPAHAPASLLHIILRANPNKQSVMLFFDVPNNRGKRINRFAANGTAAPYNFQ